MSLLFIVRINYKGYIMDFIEVANSQIEKRKRDNNSDVSFVNLYGTYLNNDTYKFSFLELLLLPKTEKGYNLGRKISKRYCI